MLKKIHGRWLRVSAVLFLCCAGCSIVRVQKTGPVLPDSISLQSLREKFAGEFPAQIQGIHSVVFQYKWRSFSALGYTDIHRDSKTFAVSCMNPVGVKLFELTGDNDSITTNFVLKELLAKGDLPKVVGEDIRKIYFDVLPAPDAAADIKNNRAVFTAYQSGGIVKHIFDVQQKTLEEKSYYEKNRCVWRVIYQEYCQVNGKLRPQKITLKNNRFGYNLIIRVKEAR